MNIVNSNAMICFARRPKLSAAANVMAAFFISAREG
jgi:hypothetical protein